jgi:tetratricopeptide (TPR) repeat protein
MPSTSSNTASNQIDRQYHHLLQIIGIAEFDLGHFDGAIRFLEASRRGVASSPLPVELERILNFLGQTYTAAGQFERAEQALTEAINLEIDPGISGAWNPWRAYNQGQLGKLYLEWERFDAAASVLVPAWNETHDLTTASLKVLVANFYAEALMHPASPGRDEANAEAILKETATLAGESGFFRSRVQAHTLLARLSLMQNRPLEAVAYSSAALEELEHRGTLPALRVEEIFFHHA